MVYIIAHCQVNHNNRVTDVLINDISERRINLDALSGDLSE